jgi:type IV pilus assembly protein PilV
MNMKSLSSQRGMMLIEALMAVLIFSLGILGLVGVNALGVASQSDAQYRTDANKFATQVINRMWLSVNRATSATIASSLGAFKHQEHTNGTCSFSGDASADDLVTNWLAEVTAAGSGLPGATAAMQQIQVANTAAGMNEVTVTLCWKASGDLVPRRHVMKSLIN